MYFFTEWPVIIICIVIVLIFCIPMFIDYKIGKRLDKEELEERKRQNAEYLKSIKEDQDDG